MRLLAALILSASAAVASGQDASSQPTVSVQMTEMLHRSGHSPTSDEIYAAESENGVTDPAVAKAVEPLLEKALSDRDGAIRRYALAMLVGMQTLPESATPPVNGAPPPLKPAAGTVAVAGLAAYKGEVAKVLAPLVPKIGAQLTDEDAENRMLATTVLGGFAPDPPAAVFPPLLGYLKRDDAIGPVGLSVVEDLLRIVPVSDATAAALVAYLRRSDETTAARTELVEGIASMTNQSQTVNKALLSYLDSDDDSLRARVILSLPQLNLAADVFSDARNRVAGIASGGQDSLSVVNAAKAVTGCWTQVKMASGCPAY